MGAAMAGCRTILPRATLVAIHRGAVSGTILLASACRHAPAPPDPARPETAPAAVQRALDVAVARYHDDGDLDLLRAWVEQHPDHADADIWREVIALRTYERLSIGDPLAPAEPAQVGDDPAVARLPAPDPQRLVALVAAYPDTLGGRTAQALLEAEGLRRLREPVLNPIAVAFLEGDEGWTDAAGVTMPHVDLHDFHARHAPILAARFAQTLVDDGCASTMGWCTWWVQRFPDAAATPAIHDAMYRVWHRRAHPRWQGRNHAACAFACARKCRQGAAPLDDGCYEPCIARCG